MGTESEKNLVRKFLYAVCIAALYSVGMFLVGTNADSDVQTLIPIASMLLLPMAYGVLRQRHIAVRNFGFGVLFCLLGALGAVTVVYPLALLFDDLLAR